MHFLMLATIALPPGEQSLDVRTAAYETLADDDSFCGNGGRFSCPIADWFVIGGRWSGHLLSSAIGETLDHAIRARFPDEADKLCSVANQQRKEIDAIWQSLGGEMPNPYSRDSANSLGYPDDAQLLTSALYDSHLSEYKGKGCVRDGYHCEYLDLDGERLNPGFVGRKWLIVIDYHN